MCCMSFLEYYYIQKITFNTAPREFRAKQTDEAHACTLYMVHFILVLPKCMSILINRYQLTDPVVIGNISNLSIQLW